jgi:HK97 family phage prohead protease
MERRYATELRAAGRELVGHAAVWDQPARIEGRFTEVVKRGSFRTSLTAGADIACLVDHDPGRLLGRTKSGTLVLNEDGKGLAFTVSVPHTGLGDDIIELARRGDLGGMSFGFRVPVGGDAWPAPDRRELRSIELAEISVVHFKPAYEGTSVAARMSVRAARLRLRLALI